MRGDRPSGAPWTRPRRRVSPACAGIDPVDIDEGALETGKEAERKVKIYVDYYALEIGDKEQCLLDAENMIARISGTDLLEAVRSHIL